MVVAATLAAAPAPSDDGRHVLSEKWARYEAAAKEDKPKTSIAVLDEIIAEAEDRHYVVDFWDAATKRVETGTRLNWKDRDALRKSLEEKVKSFDEPLVTYLWMRDWEYRGWDSRLESALSRKERLSGRNAPLYNLSGLSGSQDSFVRSDWEFILWDLIGASLKDPEKPEHSRVYPLLKEELAGRYPLSDWLDYYIAARLPDEKKGAAMEELVRRFSGRATSFYPEAEILSIRNRELDRGKGSEAEYKALYEDCKAFEKRRSALRGEDKTIAGGISSVKNLVESFEHKSVDVEVRDGKIIVAFRNLDKATVTITPESSKSKTLRSFEVKNPAKRFYLSDTVSVNIPKVDDGEYLITATAPGKISSDCPYEQLTLSVALKEKTIYVADYKSGEPVKRVHLTLSKNGKTVKETDMGLDGKGFAALPKEFAGAIVRGSRYGLTVTSKYTDGRIRKSPVLSLWGYSSSSGRTTADTRRYCNIYPDRGAFNPGDTVRFAAIARKGSREGAVSVLASYPLKAVFYDSENNEIESLSLKTGDLGTAEGSFAIPEDVRGGMFRIAIEEKSGKVLDSRSVRVDRFVLPSYDLEFTPVGEVVLPGDSVKIAGRLVSYSGHSLSAAKMDVRVHRWGDDQFLSEIEPESDGSFSFRFPTVSEGWYTVSVRVTDATGETQEFNTHVTVVSKFRVFTGVDSGAAEGEFSLIEDNVVRRPWRPYYNRPGRTIVTGASFTFSSRANDGNGEVLPLDITYRLVNEAGKAVRSGSFPSGESSEVSLEGLSSGLYSLVCGATSRTGRALDVEESTTYILYVPESAKTLDAPVERVFITGNQEVPEGGNVELRMGSANGPVWAVVMLTGLNGEVLESRMVRLDGNRGKAGSLASVSFLYRVSYPESVRLSVFYFKGGESVRFDREFHRRSSMNDLTLKFTSLRESARPGETCTVTLQTEPGVEAVVSVYDKSVDRISGNWWNIVRPIRLEAAYVAFDAACGRVSTSYDEGPVPVGYAMAKNTVALRSAAPVMDYMSIEDDAVAAPESAEAEEAAGAAPSEDIPVREKMEKTLVFYPSLRSSSSGELKFDFTASDKLSTYKIKVYAHDKSMRNTLSEAEIMITIPVKVSLVEPRYLYDGDVARVRVAVSSVETVPVEGWLYLEQFASSEWKGVTPVRTSRKKVTVPPGGTVYEEFEVPGAAAGGASGIMGLKATIDAEGCSDAVFVSLPVYPDAQTLTESHSAVLLSGMSKGILLDDLRDRFVNVSGNKASVREISLLDMVKDAVPSHMDPASENVLDLSEALYVRLLSSKLSGVSVSSEVISDEALLEKIMACRNADGGFAWFEGMNSNLTITAVLLERLGKLRDRGFSVPDLTKTVKYLDQRMFGTVTGRWYGYLSEEQYMFVRSMYPAVPFAYKPSTKEETKAFMEFQKRASAYLAPKASGSIGLTGYILGKVRRIRTLENLLAVAEGKTLSSAWGVTLGAKSKFEKTIRRDSESLVEYAVEHRDGGWYYPNAVMPWRGLLESEAYAHSMICDLLTSYRPSIADGIRIWLMLQKETQKWDADPAFVDAITSVLDGGEEVLATKVVALSATFTAPFADVKASGNGFTVTRKFYTASDRREIRPGDPVSVGDRITAEYTVWSQENRSFVRLTSPREACLKPADQLSGHIWWGRGSRYRAVYPERTEYWFEVFPEETSVIREDFFVERAGAFTAPVVEVESLYAPHYRANDSRPGLFEVR